MKKTKQVKRKDELKTPKVMRISAKCSDMFSATVVNVNDQELFSYDGYVPGFFPDQHFGDYVMLDIDLNTGRILNWKKPTAEQLERMQQDKRG